MITTIDNDLRVFLLTGDMGKKVLCNMQDVEAAIKSFDDPDEVDVKHFWNGRFVKIGRRVLKEQLKANQLNHSFIKPKR